MGICDSENNWNRVSARSKWSVEDFFQNKDYDKYFWLCDFEEMELAGDTKAQTNNEKIKYCRTVMANLERRWKASPGSVINSSVS